MSTNDRRASTASTASTAAVESSDPIAVALGNASLLGAGYLILGRLGLALAAAATTVVLAGVLVTLEQPGWFQLVVLLWWAAVTAHGWYLATRHSGDGQRPPSRLGGHGTQRAVVLAITGSVLLAVGALRYDGWRIEHTAGQAHRADECGRALTLLAGLGPAHQLADPALVARTESGREACELLLTAGRQARQDRMRAAATLQAYRNHPGARWPGAGDRRADLILTQARAELDQALAGDTKALIKGFGRLSTVLSEFPGKQARVDQTVDRFAGALPAPDACVTRQLVDWLNQQPAGRPELTRAVAVVPRLAPAALVACGDEYMRKRNPWEARDQYSELLDRFPSNGLAAAAGQKLKRADQEIQLAKVRGLISRKQDSGLESGLPEYCADPAPWSGAAAYRGKGPHRALLFGDDQSRDQLPKSWRATDAANAALVICAHGQGFGPVIETCDYDGGHHVTFRARDIDIRVYELRTGRQLPRTRIRIGGSCPAILSYRGSGPPKQNYAYAGATDIRAGWRHLINP